MLEHSDFRAYFLFSIEEEVNADRAEFQGEESNEEVQGIEVETGKKSGLEEDSEFVEVVRHSLLFLFLLLLGRQGQVLQLRHSDDTVDNLYKQTDVEQDSTYIRDRTDGEGRNGV